MKKIVTLILVLLSQGSIAQNLVPNPSFEVFDTCPSNASQISKATGWFIPSKGSPDYFNQCDSVINLHIVGVPYNMIGFQQPRTGVGYAGFMNYDTYHWGVWDTIYEFREYIEAKLIDSLQAGFKYRIQFYVSLADSACWATDGTGAFFSHDSLLNDTGWYNFQVMPQMVSPPGIPITDKINWTLVAGDFIASGGEQFITIGNFNDNPNTDTISVQGGNILNSDFTSAYYYIDDISVELDTTTSIFQNSLRESLMMIPNPSNGIITIKNENFNINQITVYDMLGKKGNVELSKNNQGIEINLLSQPDGIYIINVKTEKNIFNKKIILIK